MNFGFVDDDESARVCDSSRSVGSGSTLHDDEIASLRRGLSIYRWLSVAAISLAGVSILISVNNGSKTEIVAAIEPYKPPPFRVPDLLPPVPRTDRSLEIRVDGRISCPS